MSEWRQVALRDIATDIKDGTHGTHARVETGVPFLSAKNVSASGKVVWDDEDEAISETEYQFITSSFSPKSGDLLVTVVGTLGRTAISDGAKVAFQRSVAFVRPNKEVLPEYLFHASAALEFRRQLERRSNATAQAGLYLGELAKIRIPLPPPSHQRRIAEILSTLDEAIAQTEALIAKHQQIKAGLMHDLFTRGVTPDGHLRHSREQAPDLYKESPLGWIPKEWAVRQVRELGDVITGNTPPEYSFSGDGRGVPFVTPGDVGNAIFVSETVRSVTPGLAGMARLITPNSTCVVCIGSTIGKLALVSRESITNQQINSVLCQKRELSFLAYFSMDYFLPSQLRREAGLQAVPIVKKSVFEKLLVAWPIASEEAMEVQSKLLGVAAQLESEEAVACKLHKQKHGLMHDLLTGRVRVKPTAPDPAHA